MKLDINSITDGKAKDIILESIVRTENNLKQTEEFQKELFLNATLEDVNFLLKSIVDSKLDLIKVYSGNKTYITSIGHIKPFLKKGGFEKIEDELKKTEQKEELDVELKVLQKENFEYQKIIRKQNDRIRDLDEQIKFISLLKLYWWLIPTCIAIGIFLREFWDLIKP